MKLNKTYVEAFIPLATLAIGVILGEPLWFFFAGVFATLYLSISFQELKELFISPTGIKVIFSQLRSALEDLILLSAKINADVITYHNVWGGIPKSLRNGYIEEIENILLNT